MTTLIKYKKKLFSLTALLIINMVAVPTAWAAAGDATAYLQQIAQYTNGILTAVTSNTNPVVNAIIVALTNLTSPDNATDPATPTPNMQNAFTSYVAGTATSATASLALQQTLNQDFFGTSITTSTLPNANDLTFSTLLGQPYFSPDPRATGTNKVNPAYDYLKNAAGVNITHVIPGTNWKGASSDQARYSVYYNSISAAQTLNAYILSQYYSDLSSGLTALQTTLVNQASDPKNWFAIITNETIGAVLRQTLMYQSQSYILLTQLLQTEKLLLASQAATNTLLMLSNQTNESLLVRKAIAPMPGT